MATMIWKVDVRSPRERREDAELDRKIRSAMAAGPYLNPGQFEARWSGKCAECGGRYSKGEAISYCDDEIVCDDCYA